MRQTVPNVTQGEVPRYSRQTFATFNDGVSGPVFAGRVPARSQKVTYKYGVCMSTWPAMPSRQRISIRRLPEMDTIEIDGIPIVRT